MKKLIILLLLDSIMFACSGDCTSCHFNIDYKDSNHKIMLDCKICHTDEKLSKAQMRNSCGQDCFSCHNIEKINLVQIKEHQALNTCISCHSNINVKNKFNLNINPLFNNKLLNKKP
ncbi:hypothetical protein [Helicobacter sp. MIT 14-3879]|uniref:hypothetical protein n=1 Tax=Helicobacter sp. MIT 14-3879 TaxID=2040649 RepID=UPI000E1E95AC|nr:hypothetical protein [Helicobacter sp. MIT 14-3879]RDU62095.1 hypothetical protein CQA44_07635 [Helicobacter sp. MIT 14-3879]